MVEPINNIEQFALFNEAFSESITNLNRTFEELITERGDLSFHFSNQNRSSVDYTTLFDKIKEKLFSMDSSKKDLKINDCPIINKYREDFTALKHNVCDIYMDLMNAETELNQAREKYTTFCDSIKNCINFVHNNTTLDESDQIVKEILEKKVENYYIKLDIDNLNKKYEEAYTEFEKTKIKISLISGTILPPTICQICLEHQVEYFLDPCGHTICKQCKIICENKPDCHYCRTKKKGYKRLFL